MAALTARDDTDLPPIRRQRGRGLRALAAAAAAATVAGRDGADPEGGLVTLDEFLRETGQAGSASSEAERHLQMLLLMHRRSDRERAAESPWRRSMFDHTPVGRLRAAPFDASAPAAATTGERAGGDSFDTLVGQIRRIGALQDLMLNTVDTTAATLEDTVGSGRAAEASPPTEEEEQPANRRDRNRSIVDGLRVREARLRAMQMRIDQLVSEFATLRSTQRELRRVCTCGMILHGGG